MYSNRVFNKIQDHISDQEMLDEIHEKFHIFNKKAVRNTLPIRSKSLIGERDVSIESIANRPTEDETYEAIVLLFGRPALLIYQDGFEEPVSEVWKQRLNPLKERLKSVIRAVGRIEIKNHPSYDWVGTGWITEGNILVTNRHVAKVFGRKKGKSFSFIPNHLGVTMDVNIDFKEEYQNDDEREIQISEIMYIAPDHEPDLALLKIEAEISGIGLQSEYMDEAYVATIGYPAFDLRNGQDQMLSIFRDIYNVKRIQPGMIKEKLPGNIFLHDCSTLGGNSGSPVIDLATCKAVGLHFGGKYLKTNYAVDAKHIMDAINKVAGKQIYET